MEEFFNYVILFLTIELQMTKNRDTMVEIITKDLIKATIVEIRTKDSNRTTIEEIITKDSNRATMEEM